MSITNEAIYKEGKAYLLSFDGITEAILNNQLRFPSEEKPDSIPCLFKEMLVHATNRQGMKNYIGSVEALKNVLYGFDVDKVLTNYPAWGDVFDRIAKEVKTPSKPDRSNNKNSWVHFSKTILSVATYLSRFNTIEAFDAYVGQFIVPGNYDIRIGLPLILAEEIKGFGFALACDFLKEKVSPTFVKPDTHLKDIFIGIHKSKADASDFQIFRDVMCFALSIEKEPYEVDKLFWLIGSGNFYRNNIVVGSKKADFIAHINNLQSL
jgi:hypothetical protein